MTDSAPHLQYDRWKAPSADEQTLIWPAPAQILDDTRENHRRLESAPTAIDGIPLPEVRRALRAFLGHSDNDQPLIATGHQTELHHAGVWVKNALIHHAALASGGRAYHFAVDTDEPKHLRLRWPGGSAAISGSHVPAAWSGLLPPPAPQYINEAATSSAAASRDWHFQSILPAFFDALRRHSSTAANLSAALTGAVHDLDISLGLKRESMLLSPMLMSEPYLAFAHHVLARAEQFAADYNAALEEFRVENKIRTVGRPMPNLRVSADEIEAPFWLDDLSSGARSRAAVSRRPTGWSIRLRDGEFALTPNQDGWKSAQQLAAALRSSNMRLAPRALTLTAVFRLLVADQFVHGIGGGQYDQVLDKLIWKHFRLAPPRFSVTTATLYFPGAAAESRVCMPCLAHEAHQLRHKLPGARKQELTAAIAAAPRKSTARSRLFLELHDQLAEWQRGPQILQFEQRLADARTRELEEKVLFDRELFYAIQPVERLNRMIERYRAAFA